MRPTARGFAVALLFGAMACRRSPAREALEAEPKGSASAAWAAPASKDAETTTARWTEVLGAGERTWRGVLDGERPLAVVIRLHLDEKGGVAGRYFYESQGVDLFLHAA